MLFLCLFCLFSRGSVYTVLAFYQMSYNVTLYGTPRVGELCSIKEKGRQTGSRPGVEAHHLRLLGVYCQGLLLGMKSQFVKAWSVARCDQQL